MLMSCRVICYCLDDITDSTVSLVPWCDQFCDVTKIGDVICYGFTSCLVTRYVLYATHYVFHI